MGARNEASAVIVVCSNCGKSQELEDLFCANCGAKLVEDAGKGLPSSAELGGLTTTRLQSSGALSVPQANARLSLHIIRSGQILPLDGPGEYIVGRVSEGQSILPDVDLEPYAAYESGVSRLHARITVEDSQIWITDLGSANGTRLNDQKLAPHQAYPLSHKDVLRLGRLSIQALTPE
jgi:hypothetical protein